MLSQIVGVCADAITMSWILKDFDGVAGGRHMASKRLQKEAWCEIATNEVDPWPSEAPGAMVVRHPRVYPGIKKKAGDKRRL